MIREALTGIRDMERLAIRLSHGKADGRDLVAIADALSRLPSLRSTLEECEDPLMDILINDLDILNPLWKIFDTLSITSLTIKKV